MSQPIDGQLSDKEREFLFNALTTAARKPERVIEVGTWLGGGSTLHILRALEKNGAGHLWGVEFDRGIYDRMLENIRTAIPEAAARFTPLFGRSDEVIPSWLGTLPAGAELDFAFLDGGDNPLEQIVEFDLLDSHMPIGAQLMAHDARERKGKWFVPYLAKLDHWKCEVVDLSAVGLLYAQKLRNAPSPESKAAAAATLRGLRREPKELIARILPAGVRSLIARILPTRVMNALLHRQ